MNRSMKRTLLITAICLCALSATGMIIYHVYFKLPTAVQLLGELYGLSMPEVIERLGPPPDGDRDFTPVTLPKDIWIYQGIAVDDKGNLLTVAINFDKSGHVITVYAAGIYLTKEQRRHFKKN